MNKKVSDNAKKLISSSIKSQLFKIIVTSVLSAFSSVIYIALALVSKRIIDIASGEVSGRLMPLAFTIIALVLFQVISAALGSHLNASISAKMAIRIKKGLFASLFTKKLDKVNLYHSGDLLNRFSSDVSVVVSTATSIVPSLVSIVTRIVSGSIAILMIDWKFAAAIILLGIIVPAICKLIGHKYRYLHTKHQQSEGRLKAFLQESFKNLSVIKSFSSLKPITKKLDVLQDENYKIKIKRNNLSIVYSVGMYCFFTAGYFLVLLWGAAGIKEGLVTFGSLVAFLQIISQLRGPLQSISGIIPAYQSMLSSSERICEIADLDEELFPLSEQVSDTIKTVFKEINADSLSFSYGEHKILESSDFSVKRGTVTAITGESGVGKSTLFRLLLGYSNADYGKLTFDGKYEINASTRSLFSYVPQGNMVLSGTIRENITLCADKVSEDEISSAIKAAQLENFITSLPDGLDTYIGEDGLGISEGQAQRIAIARALVCDAPILLLDEATAALDSETEFAFLTEIKKLKDKTVILVTHRTLPENICDNHIHIENAKTITLK